MVQASRANGPYNWAPVAAVGPLETLQIQGAATYSIQCVTVGGTPTATFRLEGSLDGVNFFDLSGPLNAGTFTSITFKPIVYIRVNVITYSGTGAMSFFYFGV